MTERQLSLKNDGICLRCGSQNVRSGEHIEGKEGMRGSNRLPIDSKFSADLDNYVCTDCGYTESYMGDRGMLNRIERLWTKIVPPKDDS